MTTSTRIPALVLAVALPFGGACSDTDPTGSTAPVPTATAVPTADAATVEAYRAAVQRTIDAPALTTTARIRVQTSGGVAEVVIEVERTTDGRTLTVTTDQGTLAYEVTPDGATVDRGDGPEPIDVAEVPRTPSLSTLLEVEGLRFPEVGVATGTLPGNDLATEVEQGGGSVDVVVRYAPDGIVNGLEMRGPNDDYVALVSYRTA